MIAKPLTKQLKKDAFHWNEDATAAFNALKISMTTVPVLSLPDFSKSFLIETDASNCGLGVVLVHEKHPIAFFNKVLGKRANMKSIYEK